MKKDTIYNISLDIGTGSVGWSVTDQNYNLLKIKGKNMWGVRLFEQADTAATRRLSRGGRRRYDRRRLRISLLKELIGEAVLKQDEDFFMRLEKGFLTVEDKGYLFNLFNDENITDKNYYDLFPTIYHLRNYLCKTKEKVDIRFVYLALHHIIKYRGNFLYEGQEFKAADSGNIFEDVKYCLDQLCLNNDLSLVLTNQEIDDFITILKDTTKFKATKRDELIALVTLEDKKAKAVVGEFIKLIVGYKGSITKMFPNRRVAKEGKEFKTEFSSTSFEDDCDLIELQLNEDYEIIERAKKVYSFATLQDILHDKSYISESMVNKYDRHHEDLQNLKLVFKRYFTKDYAKMFRKKDVKGNYYSYVHHAKDTGKDDLYKFITQILETSNDFKQTKEYLDIKEKMSFGIFLERQTSKDNAAVPYQLQKEELNLILEKQGIYYPELLGNKDKIISLLTFRIPYYVGPLNNASEFSWVVRKNENRITPWTFDDEVDKLGSAEKFIRRMTNQCTYLPIEEVLPKKSLTYSMYEVLNELNKIRIDGKLLPQEAKQKVIDELFMKYKKITEKSFRNFIIVNQLYTGEMFEIRGFQKENEFASNLESWIDFKKIFADDFMDRKNDIEKIIEWISVYEDKEILEKRLRSEMTLEEVQIRLILKKRYKGWGRLSNKLLNEIKGEDKYKNKVSIMHVLMSTNLNFMQIINDKKLNFKKAIETESGLNETIDRIDYKKHIQPLQGSPAIKKGIWQTVKIVDELIQIMKHSPENIFIEFARSDEDSKRTMTRVDTLKKIYAEILREKSSYDVSKSNKYLQNLDSKKKIDDERKYLYLLQEGRCLYTGVPLDFGNLNLYEIDHIIPQSYVKDDSFENKALVLKEYNQNKGDSLLLKQEVIDSQKMWWKHLRKYNLIGEKKYRNLVKQDLNDVEKMGFINRQLVETRQITKHVANLFVNCYEETKVISIKAGLGHDFREKFDLYKIRELNDYHHAHDAYIASIIGLFVLKKYPDLKEEFIFNDFNKIKNFSKDFNKMNHLENGSNKYGFIINQLNSNKRIVEEPLGEIIWDGSETLNRILKSFEYRDCFITKQLEESKGQFFNVTILKKENVEQKKQHKFIPVNNKRKNTESYGGFKGINNAYAMAVEYVVKGKVKKKVLNVPMLYANNSKGLESYVKQELNVDNYTVIKDKILNNQLIEVDGGAYRLASASEWNNARQLVLDKESKRVLYAVVNENMKEITKEEMLIVISKLKDKLKGYYPLLKNGYEVIDSHLEEIEEFDIEDLKELIKAVLIATASSKGRSEFSKGGIKLTAFGRLNGKTIDLEKTVFVDESITGIYTKRYKL